MQRQDSLCWAERQGQETRAPVSVQRPASEVKATRLVSTSASLSTLLADVLAIGASHGLLFDRQNLGAASTRVTLGPPARTAFADVGEARVEVMNLAANSYLGLGDDKRIQSAVRSAIEQHGMHMGGSRLLCGTAEIHWTLERRLAEYFGAPSVVTYSSGYVANVAAISALFGPRDLVILDKHAHRSIYDGAVLSRSTVKRFRHNDIDHLERILLRTEGCRRRLIAVDGVYSMEGDIAPIPELVRLAREHNAFLLVDDAHAIGVLGARGCGTAEHFGLDGDMIDIRVGTLSKAIPAVGGFVAVRPDVGMILRYASHGSLYSAPLSPADAAAALAAVDVMQAEPHRMKRVRDNATFFREQMAKYGLDTMGSQTAVVPVWIGNKRKTLEAAAELLRRGVFVNAVVHPGIARGSERLRCFVMASHTVEDLRHAAEHIGEVLASF